MPGYFQQTIIIGAVGRDPELRQTNGGKQVVSFSVAVTERWRDRNGQGNTDNGEFNEKTTWYSCSAWDRTAETLQNIIRKGQNVMITGTVSARAYMGNDGQPKASLDIRVDQFRILGNRGGSGDGGGAGMGTGGDNEYDDYGGGQPSYSNNNSGGSSGGGRGRSTDGDDIPF